MAHAPPTVTRWAGLAQKYGPRYGIPPHVLLGLIDVESGGNEKAVSPAGARGLTQFIPGTARSYHVRPGDPDSEVRGAAEYLHDLGFSHDPLHALGAYNGGPANPQLGYARVVLDRAKNYRGAAGGRVRVRGGQDAPQTAPEPGVPSTGQGEPPSGLSVADLIASGLSRPQVPVTPPPTPEALQPKLALPAGYEPPVSSGAPQAPGGSLEEQLAKLALIQRPDVAHAQAPAQGTEPVRVGAPGAPARAGRPAAVGYPLGHRGKIIGTPYVGTHTLGNWQSDNAVDVAVPTGTPVFAANDGTVTRAGSLGRGGQFAGERVQIDGRKNSTWYGHLSKLGVKVGQRVRRGQFIGYSGSANGVEHLHFAVEHGDPRKIAGR